MLKHLLSIVAAVAALAAQAQAYQARPVKRVVGFEAGGNTDTVARLVQVARSPELKAMLEKQGLEPNAAGSAELAAMLRSEIETYKTVFKAANIPVQ